MGRGARLPSRARRFAMAASGIEATAAEEMAASTEQRSHVVDGISRELTALEGVAREMQSAVDRFAV